MSAVTFYNDMKGFGFAQSDDAVRSLVDGGKVLFDRAEDRRSGKTAVSNTLKA